MSYETLDLVVNNGVAHVVLNRPDAANAIDLQMSKELLSVGIELDEMPEVRAVLLRSNGKLFCSGGDLGSFANAGDRMPALLKEMTVYLHGAVTRLVRGRAPVVAAVQGAAAGAGFSLACAADLVVAAESAKFTMAYTRAGLTPDGSSTHFLPRLIGRHRTLEMILTNRVLTAVEAQDWGLVNRVVPDDELLSSATELAETLAQGPTAAYGLAKRLVASTFVESFEAQMEHESVAISDSSRSADAQEGIKAFFEKRAATFKGK